MRRFLPLTMLTLSACTGGIPVYLDTETPEEIVTATENAVERWNDALGIDALYVRDIENPRFAYVDTFSILVECRETVIGPDNRYAYTFAIGLINHIGVECDNVLSDDYFTPAHLEWLLSHELGHVLGLGHVSDEANLMDDSWVGFDNFALSRKQLRRARTIAGIETIL